MKRLSSAVLALALAVLVAAISANAADVTVGHSGWNWGNPLPQGNTLRAVEFEDSLGFAAGGFGTLLRTDDGGATWTGVRTGTTTPLTSVAIADANAVVAGGGCVLLRSDDAGQTFKRLGLNCGGSRITDVAFPSAQNGFVLLASGALLRTTDGGGTFTPGGTIAGTPTDVFFTDSSTGFAVTYTDAGGAVYRTTDGGATWFQRTTSTQGLNGVYFPSAGTGYAVGESNTVLKTTDGGETWNPKPVDDTIPLGDLASIRCGDASTCIAVTDSGDRVLRTKNGGNAYTSFSPAGRAIFAFSFPGPNKGVAVGENGTIVISTNLNPASPSFVPVSDQALAGSFSRLRSGSASLALAPGQSGKLARSTDGGRHWSTTQLPTSEDLRDVWFVDDQVGFALDAGGAVLRTLDGGGGWSAIGAGGAGIGVRANALYAVDQNVVLLFGPRGVRRSTSSTTPSFDPVDSKVANATTLTDYDSAGGAVFAYGRKGVIVSRNDGASWKRVKRPVKNARYRNVDFITDKRGFALLESGRLFKTGNAGKSWSEVVGTGTNRGYDLSFGDAGNGYLSVDRFGRSGGRQAWILHTSDGGASWRPQLLARSPLDAHGLVAPDASDAFGLAGGSEFFYTGNGGDAGATASTLSLKPRRGAVNNMRSVKIDGKLAPAVEGASITVLARNPRTHNWSVAGTRHATATGKFTISYRVTHTAQLVAQWRGSGDENGAGSPVATIVKR
jgi:photosystem II stability/assembly factor-like uncharacterized protein